MNKGGKNYIILPTLVDISADGSTPAATTSVFCPYKVYGGHHGFKDVSYNPANNGYIGSEGFFQEIMGVVPSKIIEYHTNNVVTLTQSNITTYIDKIRYHYLSDGHKVISIIYNQSAFTDQVFREIEFKILFEDGDFHTVKQFIIDSKCLDSNIGLDISTDKIFKSQVNSDGLFESNQEWFANRHLIELTNTGNSKQVLAFHTSSYTDPKWNDENNKGALIPSITGEDFFQIAYFPLGILDYDTLSTQAEQQVQGRLGLHTFVTRRLFYNFRQTSTRCTYDWDSPTGLTGGTLGQFQIDPITEYTLDTNGAQITAGNSMASQNCYKSIEFYAPLTSAVNALGQVSDSGGTLTSSMFQPTLFEIRDRSLANPTGGTHLLGGPRGYCGSQLIEDVDDKRKVGAFYIDSSGSKRDNLFTGRRVDTIIYGIRKLDGSTFSGSSFNTVDGGYDTQGTDNGGLLTNIALKLMEGAEIARLSNDQNVGQPSQLGIMSYKPIGTQNSAASMLDCNIVSPQDLISNFILGRHSFYLSRPHAAGGGINTLQGLFQASCAASLFYKNNHPSYQIPADLANVSTGNGLKISGLEEDVVMCAVPMHTYVDSHNAVILPDNINSNSNAKAVLSGKGLDLVINDTAPGSEVKSETNNELTVVREDVFPWSQAFHKGFSFHSPQYNGVKLEPNFMARPSLDKNSVRYSGSGLREPAGAGTSANSYLNFGIAFPSLETAIMNDSDNMEEAFLGLPYEETKALVLNGGIVVSGLNSDARKSYARGCIPLPRGSNLNESNYKLDLLLDPVLSNTTLEFTELQFTAKYNTGTNNLLSDSMFTVFSGSPTAGYNGEEIDCGCGSTLSNLQWTDSSNNQIDDNALDIFSIRYTPGRHPEPGFPINTDEYSLNTSVTTNSGDPGTALHIAQLTVNMDNEDPFAQDRPLVDVQMDSFQWDETFKPVSKIELSQREGVTTPQIGRNPATDIAGTNLDFSSQEFNFVALGRQVVEDGGGVADDIPGCTDSTAINFFSEANVDDGSCIYCNLEDGWGDFLRSGVTSETILPQLGITDGSAPFGMGPHYNNESYLDGTWHFGQIGNAHNHWGYGLTAALDSAGAIAVPYGEDFGDDANPYTEFRFEASFSPYEVPNVPGFEQFLTSLIAAGTLGPDAFTLSFYDIDQWTGEDTWGDTFTEATLPISGDSIGTMTNQSTDVTNLVFASYNVEDNPDGFVPNVTDPLTDGFGQTFLRPGKHYVVVLNVSVSAMVSGYIDPNSGKPVDCDIELRVPYNFWVTFCGCDIPTAPNYVGDILEGSYPWLASDISFPAGYQLIDQCVLTGSRIKRSVDAESAGYCLPLPDPFTCDNFIDACIQTTSAECIPLDNGTGQQDFVGTITVDVYGAYTSNEDGDEYSFILGSNQELFTFNLYLVEGTWDGTPPTPEDGFYYSFANEADYQAIGFNPATMNVLNLTFDNLPQGTYTAVIEQTNDFYFQDGTPCPLQQVGVPVTLLVGGDTDCPDLIAGCTDPLADNYDAEAIVDDGSCVYIECTDVFLSGKITAISTTNSTINCVQTDIDPNIENEVLVNTLVDQQTGSLTIDTFIDDFSGAASGTFVAGFCQVLNGNAGQAITNLLDLFASSENANIIDTTRTELVPVTLTGSGQVIGGFLPFDTQGNPILTTAGTQGLFAGYYAVMLIPSFVAEQDFEECATEIVSNFDSIAFATVGSTFNFTDCPTPCNDQTESEDCPDHVGGCTDENASNYNPLATFDDGTCNNGGQPECDQNPDDPDCVDCDTAASSGLRTFRDCDEFNETTEGCCDPLACNFDPTVDTCLASRCEYCCDGSDDCTDDPGQDECEDENGNILPDCVQPDCPDPNNPECDTPIVNPCPGGDCGQPPEAECVILGTCEEEAEEADDDVTVIFDDFVEEVSCTPDGLGTYSTFGEVQRAAMTCSATEGSKLLFKIKSGVKHDRTDLIKLTLINYLFNTAIDEPCMSNCDDVTNEQARLKGIERSTCQEKWRASGSQVWTPTSTYGKGTTVAVIKFLAGELRKSYYTSTSAVGSGDTPPYTSIANKKVSKWTACKDVRGKSSNNPGEPAYVYKFFEFMQKYCQQCFIGQPAGTGAVDSRRIPQSPIEPTGLVDENGNEIKLF